MRFYMKFLKKLIFLAAVVSVFIFSNVFAENNVEKIDISVSIRDDGSARIIQKWTGEFDSGTENYVPIATNGIEISDFKVSDSGGEYENIGTWDVQADFDEKKRKCGINETADGIELCFGISEYGRHEYEFEYVVSGFIKSYSDYDGTNFMFINPNMSTFPTGGNVDISLENGAELDAGNAAIWAFGYEGQIEFSNGGISAYTTSDLNGDNSMIIMLRINKGIIFPEKEEYGSFEDVKDEAFQGSDYGYDEYSAGDDEGGILETVIGFIILFGIPALIVLVIRFFVKRKREIKKFYNEAGYYRDVPNGGNIEISHYLAQTFDVAAEESLIIGALMLSMINKGCIEPETEESIGFFGKVKQSVNMVLKSEPNTNIEKRLYGVLTAAAGSDGILQEKELEKYAYKNPKAINGIIDAAKENGEAAFLAEGGFSGGAGGCIGNLSEKGKEELSQVMGLKKYLDEFSLISEREIKETVIWQDYMVYATLFGIADKVIKQFENVYPERMQEFENYNRNIVVAYSYYNSMHRAAERAIQQQRTSGLGGSASIGGGGGFSGGGSGGGSR